MSLVPRHGARIVRGRCDRGRVDREERPDIDKIYQTAHQLLTQRAGGWPLTMFINPEDQRPFFGGTCSSTPTISARFSAAPIFQTSRAMACRHLQT
jgi:hypothetical protein